jgi:DNA-binding transcriptional MerR regulator
VDIAEAAKSCGLPASTLRFYEDKGLIKSIGRQGLRRLYPENIIQRLAFISLARTAGLSLDEIGTMLADGEITIDRNLLLSKADELDKKMAEMTRMRDGLRHAAACKAPSHFECPKFLRLLNLASKRPVRPPAKLRTPRE